MNKKREIARKKRWLEGYRYIKLQYDYYVDELESLQIRRLGLTRVLTGMPTGNVGKRMDEKWVEMMEYNDEIVDYLKGTILEIKQQLKEIDDAIDELPERERAIIVARYILGKEFREILKDFPCSERTMYSIHESALELIEIPESGNEPENGNEPNDGIEHNERVNSDTEV